MTSGDSAPGDTGHGLGALLVITTRGCATGMEWVEDRGAAGHPTVHRTDPKTESPSSAQVGYLASGLGQRQTGLWPCMCLSRMHCSCSLPAPKQVMCSGLHFKHDSTELQRRRPEAGLLRHLHLSSFRNNGVGGRLPAPCQGVCSEGCREMNR